MSNITAALDSTAANSLLHAGEAALGTISKSGSGSLGPFTAGYSASVNFTGGTVNLNPPNVVEVANIDLNYSVGLHFGIDLNDFLPSLCLPQICVFGFCTPKICISWPTITIPFSFSDTVSFTADFTLNPHFVAPNWLVDVVIDGVPSLQFGLVTAGILAALALAVTAAVIWIPFIGPFIAAAVDTIIAVIGVAGLTGLLGQIITPFVSGLTFNIYKQNKVFNVLPAGGATDPAVNITITAIAASVQASDKNELVIEGDFAA